MKKHTRLDNEHELRLAIANVSGMNKAETVTAYRGMLDACQSEGRSLTSHEEKLADAYQAHLDRLGKMPVPARGIDQRSDNPVNTRPAGDSRFAYRDPHTKRWVRDLGPQESLATEMGFDDEGPVLGSIVRGMLTGSWSDLPREAAAVVSNQDASGGVTIGAATATRVIDAARAMTVMAQAGQRVIQFPEGANSLNIARVTTDPVGTWRPEGVALTSSSPLFDRITLTPKLFGILCPVSIEWLEDTIGGSELIERVITEAMARAIDSAAIRGSGNPGPTGLRYESGIETSALSAQWQYDDLLTAWGDCMGNNSRMLPSAVLLSVGSETSRRKRKAGDGHYLADNHPFATVPFLPTTAIPDNLGSGEASEIYLADFSRCIMAVRTSFKLEVLPAGSADGIDGTSQLYRWIRCYSRLDFHCEMPSHAYVLTDVLN